MKCVAKCVDGEFVSVPQCAAKHMEFFKCLQETCDGDFWLETPAEVEYEENDACFVPGLKVPIRTFDYEDAETNKKYRIRFTMSAKEDSE